MIDEQKFLTKVRSVLTGTGLELVGVKINDTKKKQVVTLLFEGDGTLEGFQQTTLDEAIAEGKSYQVDETGVVVVKDQKGAVVAVALDPAQSSAKVANGQQGPAGLGPEADFKPEDLPVGTAFGQQAQQAAERNAAIEKKKGRPKGSKNKAKTNAEAQKELDKEPSRRTDVSEGDDSVEGIDLGIGVLAGDDAGGDEE